MMQYHKYLYLMRKNKMQIRLQLNKICHTLGTYRRKGRNSIDEKEVFYSMSLEKAKAKFTAGEKVRHAKFGNGFIRILKPFEKSFVEFVNNSTDENDKDARCIWVKKSELVKEN